MRSSRYLISTLKETPADAEIISHQLMLRAGMIRKLASGLYTWLPTGLRVLRKVENIVRQEMNRSGAIELLMPVVQPAELWEESGRWEQFGPELLRIADRHDRTFCLGPTHEEVITDLARKEIRSYKQLPVNFYQIQTKFRDEVRPRFGVMRAREFTMKDAYSFHADEHSLVDTYNAMYDAYCRIFGRMGLKFRAVLADTGSIGGNGSHEFHVLADSGEDAIAFSDGSDYAANIEKAECIQGNDTRAVATLTLTEIATPGQHSIEEVCNTLNVDAKQVAKTLIVRGDATPLVALVLRGDHDLNEIKAQNVEGVANPLEFASDEDIKTALGCGVGSIGPVGLNIPCIIDRAASLLSDFVCGANKDGYHLTGVNWERDVAASKVVDLRNIVAGDPSPDGKGVIDICRGIEVGHIFQLGEKYSAAMKATVLNEQGKEQLMPMGCYGIGVSRIVAAAIEQNNDDKGIIWPDAIAPFHIVITPINMQRSHRVEETAEKLYEELTELGFDVLFDDRKERPGVMFADSELMGIPHRLVIGDKTLDNGEVEYKNRRNPDAKMIGLQDIVEFLKDNITL